MTHFLQGEKCVNVPVPSDALPPASSFAPSPFAALSAPTPKRTLSTTLLACALIILLAVASLLSGCGVLGGAVEPDLSRKGLVTISFRDTHSGEAGDMGGTGAAIIGGMVTLYRVGSVDYDPKKGCVFMWDEAVMLLPVTLPWSVTQEQLESSEGDEWAKHLAQEIAGSQVKRWISMSNDNGTCVFGGDAVVTGDSNLLEGLELGLYLAVQESGQEATHYHTMTPFFAILPSAAYKEDAKGTDSGDVREYFYTLDFAPEMIMRTD